VKRRWLSRGSGGFGISGSLMDRQLLGGWSRRTRQVERGRGNECASDDVLVSRGPQSSREC